MNLQQWFKLCAEDNYDQLLEVLRSISDVNYQDNQKGWNLLIVAAFNHSYSCVKLLLKHGADINSTNYKGTSVLMYAKTKVSVNRNFDFLKYLIENGANINHRDIYNKTVLDYVIESGDKEMITFFKAYTV